MTKFYIYIPVKKDCDTQAGPPGFKHHFDPKLSQRALSQKIDAKLNPDLGARYTAGIEYC
jgi:hypothetical protein